MSTSITLPTELEAKIAELAAEQGKDVEQFALEALRLGKIDEGPQVT